MIPSISWPAVQCPCCSNLTQYGFWAVVSPFILGFVRPSCPGIVRLMQCLVCEHRFFSYGFSDVEMDRLYGKYRGEQYFTARHHAEPWYGRSANLANQDQVLITARNCSLLKFLRPFIPASDSGLVIADIGGDAGQFIPLEIARASYLIEASDQVPVPGVLRVADTADLPENPDLVLCVHVLEHLPSPVGFLKSQFSSARIQSGCLVYLEVPLERFEISELLRSGFYFKYLTHLNRFRLALIAIDFLSVLARAFAGRLFPPLIVKMHEHVNFFSVQSLSACIQTLGLELIAIGPEYGSSLSTHQGVIRALARKV